MGDELFFDKNNTFFIKKNKKKKTKSWQKKEMCGIFIVAACNGFVASGQFFDTESVKEKKERRKQCGVCIFYFIGINPV